MLRLGKVEGAVRIFVNGQEIKKIDLLADEHNLGRLRAGTNQLSVQIATTLLNRLRVFIPDSFARLKPQEYGIHGPIEVKPYILVKVR
jgi:hypothetical protein